MCEKDTEFELHTLLINENFNKELIFSTINKNSLLKDLFKNCSKTGNGFGIPDRIYLDKNTIIIFECKFNNLNKAIEDIKFYINNLIVNNYNIFGVAFINKNIYSIFKIENKNIIELPDKFIKLSTFNLENNISNININNINMRNEIHIIHNYIRDNTKISNEDKAFFIAIILISIKKSSFVFIFNEFNDKKFIYDILLENLNDFDININNFVFLRNDNNNIHLYTLIKMIFDIYNKNPNIDLLNEFYSEFVKYNNSDSKSLGIVLTPHHIVKLMVEILNIDKDDIVLDLCTGTGSFLMEVSKHNYKKLIGCEYQNKLYTLFKCNTLLRNIKNIEMINDNCFNHNFKANKSLINPPYSIKNEPEFKFILKQLESLDENGLATAIIPISNLTNNKSNNKFKKEILNISNVKAIIICKNELFYPYANIGCCILLLEKNINGNQIKTKIIDYTDDGFDLFKNVGFKKSDRYETLYNELINKLDNGYEKELIVESDWQELEIKISNEIDISNLTKTKLEIEYIENKMNLSNLDKKCILSKYKIFNLEYLFNIIKKPNIEYKNSNINKKVLLISAKNNNNGVTDFINFNSNTFYGNKIVLITSGNGGAGLAFYQKNDFNITSATIVLDPKNINLNINIGIFIANELSKNKNIYSRHNTWRLDLIKKTQILLPVINDEIDYEFINKLY